MIFLMLTTSSIVVGLLACYVMWSFIARTIRVVQAEPATTTKEKLKGKPKRTLQTIDGETLIIDEDQ